ncbi:hypothetical protein KG090_00505 [Carnobacteriaceae bacterium zg-ZUI240]|nr:hypothetical protein [Carnobacteriaceae bacterium zg-ZUI240]
MATGKLTQQELKQLALEGVDRRINELNVVLMNTKSNNVYFATLNQIKAYLNIKKSLIVD